MVQVLQFLRQELLTIFHQRIFSMSDEWFDEYNYEVMVDKKYIGADSLSGNHAVNSLALLACSFIL